MPFNSISKPIKDVLVITPSVFQDERGFFKETFKSSYLKAIGIDSQFKQDNESWSRKGILRGLHYQLDPMSQGKMVHVTIGSVYDVAVDLRRGSPTFGKWVSEILTATNHKIFWIPPGFAHGFYALEDSFLSYKSTNEYSKEHESGIIWNDPGLDIQWPSSSPILNEKDKKWGDFESASINFQYKINNLFLHPEVIDDPGQESNNAKRFGHWE